MMNLAQLKQGQCAVLTTIGGEGALRQHFLDMGLIPGTVITYVKAAPLGDPVEYRVWGYELTLRIEEAERIEIDQVRSADKRAGEEATAEGPRGRRSMHPGLGEMGIYHTKQRGETIVKGELLTFGLAGNQNCGKTTLFNQLTGANQHVGNFPGVTVDRKDGPIRKQENTLVTDLPGIYSLSPYTSEEIVTRQFFLEDRPKGIINIVDATNIERNLYLTLQLIELDIPMVLALNMMDEVRENGGTVDVNLFEQTLGIPVVPISAVKNEGIEELVEHAVHVARYRERPGRMDFCDVNGADCGAMHRCIHSIMHLIEDHAHRNRLPVRFAASKLVEGDERVSAALHLDDNELAMIEHIIAQMEAESGMDRQAALANMRFSFINRVCSATVVKPRESREHRRSQMIDRFLTGKYTASPCFAMIMVLVFYLTFGLIGARLSEALSLGIDAFTGWASAVLSAAGVNEAVHSLVIDGVFAGVGSVLGFLPTIVTLFFFLSLLEDSGYMARVAFVVDKLLRKVGLSGRSFVPMLVGFGCSVPAIMATRTLPSERDRRMTILLTPFMSCSAKMPVYGFFAAAFFPGKSAFVMTVMYVTGIAVGIVVAFVLDHTAFRGKPVPFVMELPNYRLPGVKSVGRLIWDKAKDFLTRAFTVIFFATIIIWFLQSFDMHLDLVKNSEDSMLAALGGLIAPVFGPLGFGDWRLSTALITGFMAKESVVSTLTVLGAADVLTPFTAAVFLVFTLLYTPCVAAIAAVKRELGGWWAAIVAFGQCAIAWAVALVFRLAGGFFF